MRAAVQPEICAVWLESLSDTQCNANQESAPSTIGGSLALCFGGVYVTAMPACLLAVIVIHAYAQDTSGALQQVLPTVPVTPIVQHEEPSAFSVIAPGTLPSSDAVLQGLPFRAAPAPLLSFDGDGASRHAAVVEPPDANAAVGPSHLVEMINYWVTIFDRKGNILWGPASTLDLWQGFPGTCSVSDTGDPLVLYDQLADRWLVTHMAWDLRDGFAHQCVAVSQTGDPLGKWNRYQFPFAHPPDFGKIGLWPLAYVFSTYVTEGGGAYVCAFDRARMLEGAPAVTQQCFAAPTGEQQPLPATLEGAMPPPAGTDAYFVSSPVQGTFGVFRLHLDWAVPASSSLSRRLAVAVAPYDPAAVAAPIAQPGTSQTLLASAGLLRAPLAYRNFGDHEALVTAHTVSVNGIIGVRWYELRPDGAQGMRLAQQGTFAPDSQHRFMPAIGMDHDGNVVVAYSVSSASLYPSLRFAARQPADTPGELSIGEGSLLEGSFSQTSSARWGDYAILQMDPLDDCTFWFTGEYAGVAGPATRISAFRLPGCGVNDDFLLSISPGSQSATPSTSTTFGVQTAVASGATQRIALSVAGLPAGVRATFSPSTVVAGEASVLTLDVGSQADASTTNFTVHGTGEFAARVASATLAIRLAGADAGTADAGIPAADAGGLEDAGASPDAGGSGSAQSPPPVHDASGGCTSFPYSATPMFVVLLLLRLRRGRRHRL